MICIPPELIEDVKRIVTQPSSISREKQLTELFGSSDVASEINIAYEKSLLLQNQKTAINKFINNFTELGQQQKIELSDRIRTRLANRTQKIQDDELLAIAQDIYNKKYKLDIPLEDIQKLNQVKIQIDDLNVARQGKAWGSVEANAYGDKVVEMRHLLEDLKNPRNTMSIKESAKDILKTTAQRFEGKTAFEKGVEGVKIAGDILTSAIYKSVQASLDMSYSLRQGFKVMTSNPKVWKENWVEAFKPFTKIASKKEQQIIADKFVSKIVSHPLYEQALSSKLAIGVVEDFFPTTLAEKIPVLGNIFKSSNEAFTIFSQGSRMGLFEDMIKNATEKGVQITPEIMKDFATVANSITGRGSLGKLESQAGLLNKIFYSARYISSALDTFTMPFNTSLDTVARQEAMKVSVKNLSTIAALMYTASLFTDVESDPLSSKFGKMRTGENTWVDLTGGLGSYMTLASRIWKQKSKSSTTGKVSDLNTGKYGSRTTFDVLADFATNKLAPAPSTAVQILKGRDFSGEKPTIGGSAKNLAMPITFNNSLQSFQDNDTATALISSMFDVLGASSTDYNKFKKTGK